MLARVSLLAGVVAAGGCCLAVISGESIDAGEGLDGGATLDAGGSFDGGMDGGLCTPACDSNQQCCKSIDIQLGGLIMFLCEDNADGGGCPAASICSLDDGGHINSCQIQSEG